MHIDNHSLRRLQRKRWSRWLRIWTQTRRLAPTGLMLISYFFNACWDIVKEDLVKAIENFFKKGKLLKLVNSTFLVIIPKVYNPVKFDDFWPIALCNVI